MSKRVVLLVFVLALGSCSLGDTSTSDDGVVTKVARPLYLVGAKWPNGQVPVCFDQNVPNPDPAFLADLKIVRVALAGEWSAVAHIDFTGWGQCPTNRNGKVVLSLVTTIPPDKNGVIPWGLTDNLGYPGTTGSRHVSLIGMNQQYSLTAALRP